MPRFHEAKNPVWVSVSVLFYVWLRFFSINIFELSWVENHDSWMYSFSHSGKPDTQVHRIHTSQVSDEIGLQRYVAVQLVIDTRLGACAQVPLESWWYLSGDMVYFNRKTDSPTVIVYSWWHHRWSPFTKADYVGFGILFVVSLNKLLDKQCRRFDACAPSLQLTRWGRVMHICGSKLSMNKWWYICFVIDTLGTNFSNILSVMFSASMC